MPIVHIHSISVIQDGSIAFTDQDSRLLKVLQSEGVVKVIAGIGEEGNKNGSGTHSAFGQPIGICTFVPNRYDKASNKTRRNC